MKKGVKRSVRGAGKFDIEKTLAFRLLIINLFVLIILVILYSDVSKETLNDLRGELSTLKLDLSSEQIRLDVLGYNVGSDNQTIEINIGWSEGEITQSDFNSIFIKFIRDRQDCNYTQTTNLMAFGENKTYLINSDASNCESDFQNITSIESYAEVDIHLSLKHPIENITIYNDDSLTNVFDLDDYFICLEKIDFNFVGDSENKIDMSINSTTNKISFNPKLDRYGIYVFNLTAVCDGEIININTDGKNMSFNVVFIDSNRPIFNDEPKFLVECKIFTIDLNKTNNLKIDVVECFDDSDGNNLTFRFINSNMKNISLKKNGEIYTLTPKSGFIGMEYFYVYAHDGIDESGGKVYINVINSTTSNLNSTPKIKSVNVASSEAYLFPNETQTFSIAAENYDIILWYLDGVLKKSNSSFFNTGKLDGGNYSVKVEVKKGNQIDSKTWKLIVEDDEKGVRKLFNTESVIFYLIIGVIIIIIFLIVWLFLVEKNKQNKNEDFGFGVSGTPVGKTTSIKEFR